MSTQAQVMCPQCDTENPYTVLVCWICGAKLPLADVAAAPKTPAEPRRKKRRAPARQPVARLKHLAGKSVIKSVMRRCINALAVLLWVFVVVACGYFSLSGPASDDAAVTPSVITLRTFEQLQTGMTYKECVTIIGTQGVQKDLTYIQRSGLTITTYIWQNNDGSNIMAEFENNRLTTKVQAGLPTLAPAIQQPAS